MTTTKKPARKPASKTKAKSKKTTKAPAKTAKPKGISPEEMNHLAVPANERIKHGTSYKELKSKYGFSEKKVKDAEKHFTSLLAKKLREEKKLGQSIEFMAADSGVSIDNAKRLIAGRPLKWSKPKVETKSDAPPDPKPSADFPIDVDESELKAPTPADSGVAKEMNTALEAASKEPEAEKGLLAKAADAVKGALGIGEKKDELDKAAEDRKEISIKISKIGGKIGSGRKAHYTGKMLWPVLMGQKVRITRTDSRKHKNFKTSEVVEICKLENDLAVFKTRHGTMYEAVRY